MNDPLSVLSYGAGQDSAAILALLIEDRAFRRRYAPGHLLVLMADTGNEHPHTYEYVTFTREQCAEHGVPFLFLTPDQGYHTSAWQSLPHQLDRTHTIVGKAMNRKACTSNLKLAPLYKALDAYLAAAYGLPGGWRERGGTRALTPGKKALYAYAQRHGRVPMMIGFAAGEERRAKTPPNEERFMRECIQRVYPLLDAGLDRAGAQQVLRDLGWPVPPPSNCVMCPFKRDAEILWTARTLPEDFATWQRLEAQKLAKFAHKGDKNMTVFGDGRTLGEVAADAAVKYATWSEADLEAYRMTHGHGVTQGY